MTTSGEEPRDRYTQQHPATGQPTDQPPNGNPPHGSWPHGGPPPAGAPATAANQDERSWAMTAHVGSFIPVWFGALGLLAPLLVLLARGNKSPYVRRHAVESLNFQINALVYIAVCLLLFFVLIGIPLLILYGIFYVVTVVRATMRASNGEEYRYPATIRLVS